MTTPTNEERKCECGGKIVRRRDRTPVGEGSSRFIMTGVHDECNKCGKTEGFHYPIPAREEVIEKLEGVIKRWRSEIIGIAADPLKSSIPQLDEALNQLTMAIRARDAQLASGNIEEIRQADRAALLSQLEAEVERLPQGAGIHGALDIIRSYKGK